MNIVEDTINESGPKTATLHKIANMNSKDEISKGNLISRRPNQKLKNRTNKEIRNKISEEHYEILNRARIDTVGKDVVLSFSELQEDMSYKGLVFKLDIIEVASTKRVVFSGMGSVNNKQSIKMYIQYDFNPKENKNHFYRVAFYASGAIRRLHELELDVTNSKEDIENANTCNKLLKFITTYIYKVLDGDAEIKAKQ